MGYEEVTELFGRKRALEILEFLENHGESNFKNVDDGIRASSDTISNTLKLLEDKGLVTRNQYNVNDVRYKITQKGRDSLDIISGLLDLFEEKTQEAS